MSRQYFEAVKMKRGDSKDTIRDWDYFAWYDRMGSEVDDTELADLVKNNFAPCTSFVS